VDLSVSLPLDNQDLWTVLMDSRRCRNLWMQLYRLEPVLADPPHPPSIRLYRGHCFGLFHPRVSPIPHGQRSTGRGTRILGQVPR
jgi:hypothetical protein